MSPQSVAFALLLAATPVEAWQLRANRTISTGMRPALTASLLAHVEADWHTKAVMALTGIHDKATVLSEMKQSCFKITTSIVRGSSGNKDNIVEYMQEVCAFDANQSQEKISCQQFAKALRHLLTDDEARNRNELAVPEFCTWYYNEHVVKGAQAEADRINQESGRAKKDAEEKAKTESEDIARREAQEKAKKEVEQIAFQAEERTMKEAQEKVKKEPEQKAPKRQDKARKEVQDKARKEAKVEMELRKAEELARQKMEWSSEKRR